MRGLGIPGAAVVPAPGQGLTPGQGLAPQAQGLTPGQGLSRSSVQVRYRGLVDYEPTWRAMQRFTDERGPATPDEIWMVEHPPVFTLGMNAKREHLLSPGDIPVIQIDRGGEVTYHGPGQLVVYPLIDVRRLGLSVRQLVVALENAVIEYAAALGILASGSRAAPGVYVDGAKLASVGLRIRRGASYHGLALNVSTDLEPFSRINVCGHRGLAVTRLADLGGERDVNAAALALLPFLCTALALWPVHDTALAGEAAPIGDAPRAAGQPAAAAAHSAINTELQAVSSR